MNPNTFLSTKLQICLLCRFTSPPFWNLGRISYYAGKTPKRHTSRNKWYIAMSMDGLNNMPSTCLNDTCRYLINFSSGSSLQPHTPPYQNVNSPPIAPESPSIEEGQLASAHVSSFSNVVAFHARLICSRSNRTCHLSIYSIKSFLTPVAKISCCNTGCLVRFTSTTTCTSP